MKFFIGVTDNEWYGYLASLQPDEVNFWRPSGIGFQAILSNFKYYLLYSF